MRSLLFSVRNGKEILRDPLSYAFTLGLPIVLLIIFQVIANVTPAGEAYWFELPYLAPGIALFSFSFVMLYTAILVSSDKGTAFLSRLYTSPMKSTDFIVGYTLPGVVICILQLIICYITVFIISLITGVDISISAMLITIPVFIPIMILFVAVGIIFGSLFSAKSAPALSSIVIQVVAFLGGIWMPVSTMGAYETVCQCLPFYPMIEIARSIFLDKDITDGNIPLYAVISLAYIVVMFVLSVVCFKAKSKSDNK